jgi:hypothetical protein
MRRRSKGLDAVSGDRLVPPRRCPCRNPAGTHPPTPSPVQVCRQRQHPPSTLLHDGRRAAFFALGARRCAVSVESAPGRPVAYAQTFLARIARGAERDPAPATARGVPSYDETASLRGNSPAALCGALRREGYRARKVAAAHNHSPGV